VGRCEHSHPERRRCVHRGLCTGQALSAGAPHARGQRRVHSRRPPSQRALEPGRPARLRATERASEAHGADAGCHGMTRPGGSSVGFGTFGSRTRGVHGLGARAFSHEGMYVCTKPEGGLSSSQLKQALQKPPYCRRMLSAMPQIRRQRARAEALVESLVPTSRVHDRDVLRVLACVSESGERLVFV
jgi:hypothetical protein